MAGVRRLSSVTVCKCLSTPSGWRPDPMMMLPEIFGLA